MVDDARFAMVQEADVGETLAILKTRAPGTTRVIVLSALPRFSGAFVTNSDTRRAAFGGRVPPGVRFDKRASAELVGAKVLSKGTAHVDLLLQSGAPARLEARGGRVTLRREFRALEGEPTGFAEADGATVARWQAEAVAALPKLARHGVVERAEALKRAVAKAEARLARRVLAIEGDLTKMDAVSAVATRAAWLVPAAKSAARGATELRIDDDGTGQPVVMKLDPSKPAISQLDALFRKAKRLRLGREVARTRLETTQSAVATLSGVRKALENPELDADRVEALAREAKDAAPRDVSLPSRSASPERASRDEKRSPFKLFYGLSGARILVGRGADDNDALTFHVASPHDVWVHAKERRGAHVIVPLARGKSLPEGALVEAAHLAAHFSEARDEAVIDVQYTPRKHLRKPRGAAKGFVVVDREKVLVLRVDPSLVSKLLDREEEA
jgi:hypothetical protein